MSKALPAYMYKDPSEVLERKQEAAIKKSCLGCIHGFSMEFASGMVAQGCDKHKRYGRRCELYQEIK